MTKIKEIIKIQSGYASYVNLREEYFDEGKRRDRMERYKPITAHRLAFEKIANSVLPQDRRFYFLSGSYGTGKSHLCLMLASYFAHQSTLPEMEVFFKNYESAQSNVLKKEGQKLEDVTGERFSVSNIKLRRKEGRFLVAICNFGLGLDFEGEILNAVQEALELEDKNIELDSHYGQALLKLAEIEKSKVLWPEFLSILEKEYPDWTEKKLKKGLKDFHEQALNIFKQCFKGTTLTEFTFDKSNLSSIIQDITNNEKFKKKYKGIAIIYDELGYALDEKRVNLRTLHDFAEFCANSGMKSLPVIFVGTGHKSFASHGEVGDKVHYLTLQARVQEVALRTEGMEDIIGAIVQSSTDSNVWKMEVVPNKEIFAMFPVECKRLGIFTWLPAPVLERNIIENIFPMHPLATYALLELARNVGSDNRSVFKFFSTEFKTGDDIFEIAEKYTFPWFANTNEILTGSKLNLYTADLLVDYFIFQGSGGIDTRSFVPKIKEAISDFEKTIRELKKYVKKDTTDKLFDESDSTMESILKTMLIFEIISNRDVEIIPNEENICFALNEYSKHGKAGINERLKKLVSAGIIYKNQEGYYEFKKSGARDINQLIDNYKSVPENRPSNVLQIFKEKIWNENQYQYFEAKDENLKYNEDKRVKTKFISASEFTQSKYSNESFYGNIEDERQKTSFGKDYYEGTVIVVYCENIDQINQSKAFTRFNNNERIYVAIPKNPITFEERIFTFMAVEYIEGSSDFKNFTSYELAQLSKIKDDTQKKLRELETNYFNNSNLIWYGKEGATIQVAQNKFHDVANIISKNLYKDKRNLVPHPYFNKSHIKISGGSLQKLVSEAIDLLADFSKPIEIDHSWADNRGGINYVKKLFVDHWVLNKIANKGDIYYYEISDNIERFAKDFPAYSWLLNRLNDLEKQKPVLINSILKHLYETYGLGDIAITFFLILAKRYYKDSLIVKKEEMTITDLSLSTGEELINLVNGNYPNAVVIIQSVSKEDKEYFDQIYKVFDTSSAAGKTYGLNEAFNVVKNWWDGQSIIVKVEALYGEPSRQYIKAFNKIETSGPYAFIKHDILELNNIEKDEKLTETKRAKVINGIKEFLKDCGEVEGSVRKRILKELCSFFQSEGETDEHLKDSLKQWFEVLDERQKNSYSDFQVKDTRGLLKAESNLSNIGSFIFETLPETMDLGRVADWTDDKVQEYVGKIKDAKKKIDDNKIKVQPPIIKFVNAEEDINARRVKYSSKLRFEISPGENVKSIFITDDGSDPKDKKSHRKKITNDEVLEISGNKKLQIVAEDAEGNYSDLVVWSIFDKNQEVIINGQPDIYNNIQVNFIFPKDKDQLKVSLKSFLDLAKKHNIVTDEELIKIFSEILKEK